MKMSIVLFAGAIFASSMPAAGTNPMNCAKHVCCRTAGVKAATTADPGAAERLRMKFGRSTSPAVVEMCATKTVAPRIVAPADPGAQERFRMKFGRTTKPEVNPSLLASATDACGANCCTC